MAAAGGDQGKSEAQSAGRLPPEVPRPHFMRKRPFIPDELLQDKREGWYLTLLPGVGYNPAKGFMVAALSEMLTVPEG